MTLRDIPISACLKTSPKVLEIGYHPTELVMSLLDKFTENSMFSFNIGL